MTTDQRLILTIDLSEAARSKIEPLLGRAEVDAREATDPAQAARLLREESFDLVVIGYPPQTMELDPLLGIIRKQDSASRRAGVLLIGTDVPDPAPRGVNRAVSQSAPANVVFDQAASLLNVQPRADVRALVKLEVALGDAGTAEFVAQSQDISTTGMLIRTERRPAVGSRLPLRVQASGSPNPVKAIAEVVRHADRAREKVSGFAVRFVDVDPLSRQQLQKIIQRALKNNG